MAFLAKQMVVFPHSEYMVGFHDNHWMSESPCAVLVASAAERIQTLNSYILGRKEHYLIYVPPEG